MSSDKQIAANRENAQYSTGPNTPEGKAASSENATKDGFYSARKKVISWESQDDYDLRLNRMWEYYAPATPEEEDLVEALADTKWRLKRVMYLEAALDDEKYDSLEVIRETERLGRHQVRLTNLIPRLEAELKQKQQERQRQARTNTPRVTPTPPAATPAPVMEEAQPPTPEAALLEATWQYADLRQKSQHHPDRDRGRTRGNGRAGRTAAPDHSSRSQLGIGFVFQRVRPP